MESSDLVKRITIKPLVYHGKPVIRNMRYPVDLIPDLLAPGMTHAEIPGDYKSLGEDDIRACIAYASPGIYRT